MIKNIVFDMGGVLIDFDPARFVRRYTADPGEAALLENGIFRTVEWALMDWGYCTEEEACRIFCSRLPEKLHAAVKSLVYHWEEPLCPIEGMEALIRRLKARGYGIYLLSNATTRQPDYWHRIPGWDCFDGTVISAFYHQVKPQSEIYRTLLEKYGLQAQECVFVDDLAQNVAGARLCNWQGIVFHNPEQLRRELEELGVNTGESE